MNQKWGGWNLALGAGIVIGAKYVFMLSLLMLPHDPRGDDPQFLTLAALVGAFGVIPYLIAGWRKNRAQEGHLVWMGYAGAWVLYLIQSLSSPGGAASLASLATGIIELILHYLAGWLVLGLLILGFLAFVFVGAFFERAADGLNREAHSLSLGVARAAGRLCGRVLRSFRNRS